MPEYYSSIGEAVGAAMQHNIRLVHRYEAPSSETPLQVRHLPSASADPYSVRGMIARLTEDATPDEVAGIIEDVNGALVGALPQLTELVAAADWTRVRLSFEDPHRNPTFETWTRLAAAYGMLQDVREQLEVAEDGVAACPAERTDPRYHKRVNVLRTRELLDDVLGAGPAAGAPSARVPDANRASPPPGTAEVPASLVVHSVGENAGSEARRQAVARQVSPVATKATTGTTAPSPVAPPPPAAHPTTHQR
ncbi:hypothetical protein ABZ501_27530 [Streptomyces sp. NPDC019922]|uniref:hypothetical protein n=1 Tax=Streptomyces TaxID=1883 RepID=UPI001369785A|nr:hypothetical protein [Streptomyces sp. SID7834]